MPGDMASAQAAMAMPNHNLGREHSLIDRFLDISFARILVPVLNGIHENTTGAARICSSVLLALSALAAWALSQPGIAEQAASLRVLQLLGFATGGVGYVALPANLQQFSYCMKEVRL